MVTAAVYLTGQWLNIEIPELLYVWVVLYDLSVASWFSDFNVKNKK